jgi:hypothetical protein
MLVAGLPLRHYRPAEEACDAVEVPRWAEPQLEGDRRKTSAVGGRGLTECA